MGDLASVVLDSLGEPQDRIPLSADCVPLPLEITKTRGRREAYKQRTASMRVWSARCQCNLLTVAIRIRRGALKGQFNRPPGSTAGLAPGRRLHSEERLGPRNRVRAPCRSVTSPASDITPC